MVRTFFPCDIPETRAVHACELLFSRRNCTPKPKKEFSFMACATATDLLRAKAEDLGETLLLRASYKDPWLNLIPRDTYPRGAGYVRSTFTIGRSEPTSDEETWNAIAPINDNNGACAVTYNAVTTGMKEDTYKPETFGLVGPLMCQDEFVMNWKSAEFWEKYFQALEKRNRRSISNRLGNVYMQYVPKASCNASFQFYAGDYATQVPAAAVDLTSLDANAGNLPDSELTQEMLDITALELIEEGADDPNTNGWVTQGENGPEFPLYIGPWASKRIFLNNSELRSDVNNAWSGKENVNPLLKRLGASRVLGNFRHVINNFPPRWKLDTDTGTLVRVPTWIMSSAAANATKGSVAVINPDWRDASVAAYEGAVVFSPWVMREEVLEPVNSATGMKFNPQNYYGEWDYITGNDAVLGFDSCTGMADPKKKLGRHFAEYRHALKPLYPVYGRLILMKRCPNAVETITCT